MKTPCFSYAFFAAAMVAAQAQSTWNYFISDAGGGNSLVAWNVTGSLASSPGATVLTSQSSLAMPISAPGIYNDSFAGNGALQTIPTPDGSYYQLGGAEIYFAIVAFQTYNAPAGGGDTFGLTTGSLPPHTGDPGNSFLYHPGTQSVLIPVDYASFNPGTYQSQYASFNTPVTVNLTVGAVPEPSARALSALGCLGGWLLFRSRFRGRGAECEV